MKERKNSGNSILRLTFVGISLLLQAAWILTQILWLNQYYEVIYLISVVLSIVVVLKLYSKHTNAAMKMPWIMLILALPVTGISLYLMFELLGKPGAGKRIRAAQTRLQPCLPQDPSVAAELEKRDAAAAGQSRYLQTCAGSPVYANTDVRYYGEAADAFHCLKEELQKAEAFIFMEYFIIEDGSAFRELEEILIRKAGQGVDVRILYDDIGSVGYVNWLFAKRLNDQRIRCQPFNPALPVLNLFMNHRDHRKITVIDGKVGFTGGYNLAEAYFDRARPYGKWKDTGIRLEGDAVRSLTAAFLQMWYAQTREEEDCDRFLNVRHSVPSDCFVQPYLDNPLGHERVAEDVYLNLINQATKTLWFVTPYLIITDELNRALGLAAKRGVDVRIVTPGIPDKKTVYAVTRSYYAGLAAQGVRILEYTPGFCHAKQCLCDGKLASIGTSNLDYRSLYHHFENNVLLIGGQAVQDMAADFERVFSQCREVTDDYRSGRGAMLRLWQCMLRLFSPLM